MTSLRQSCQQSVRESLEHLLSVGSQSYSQPPHEPACTAPTQAVMFFAPPQWEAEAPTAQSRCSENSYVFGCPKRFHGSTWSTWVRLKGNSKTYDMLVYGIRCNIWMCGWLDVQILLGVQTFLPGRSCINLKDLKTRSVGVKVKLV